jgi:uncharacterized membrane protein YsdA (DUF1294 family)
MDRTTTALAIAALLALINIITYALFGIDKRRARAGRRRIRERTLLLWSAAGGWPAAFLAMRTLRHKTIDRAFRRRYWGVVIAWIAGVAVAIYAAT